MKRKSPYYLFFFLLVSGILSVPSCKDKYSTLNINYQYGLFPLSSTHYVDYDVDSITYLYNDNYIRDTARYQLREMVGDTFYDNTGQLNYALNLYRRPDSLSAWVFWKKWSVRLDPTRLLLTEDDLKFVKLTFPPQTGLNWNGNEFLPTEMLDVTPSPYATFANWNYFYASTGAPYTVNGVTYNNCADVVEVNDSSLIQKTYREEVYAQGIGMIYQAWESVSKGVAGDFNTGMQNGFRIRMYIHDYNP